MSRPVQYQVPFTCQMLVDWRASKPNPQGFEDFDIEVLCGQIAEWKLGGEETPSVCSKCRDEIIRCESDLIDDYSR